MKSSAGTRSTVIFYIWVNILLSGFVSSGGGWIEHCIAVTFSSHARSISPRNEWQTSGRKTEIKIETIACKIRRENLFLVMIYN